MKLSRDSAGRAGCSGIVDGISTAAGAGIIFGISSTIISTFTTLTTTTAASNIYECNSAQDVEIITRSFGLCRCVTRQLCQCIACSIMSASACSSATRAQPAR